MSAMPSSPAAFDAAALLADLLALPAEARLDAVRAAGEPDVVLPVLAEEAERLTTVEVGRALAATELIVGLADATDAPRARAETRGAWAMALAYAGQFEDALAACEQAEAIAEGADLRVEAARSKLASVHALASLGRFDEAIRAGELARDRLVAADELALAARADVSIGATYGIRDEPVKALDHYDRARSVLAGDPLALAQIETNRGIALTRLDDFSAAERAFESAVSAFTSGGLVWAAAIAQGNLAVLQLRQGRLGRALHHFEQARRCLEQDESPADLARLVAEQADALALLGLSTEAVAAYEDALPRLEEHGLAVEVADARAGYGRALLQLGRREEGESALTEAAVAYDPLGMPASRSRVDLARAEVALADGRLDEAKTLLDGAYEILRGRPAEAIVTRHLLARLALASGDLEAAADHVGDAVGMAEALDLAPALADLYHSRGLLERARGDAEAALESFRAAVLQVERVRGTLQAERFRAAFLGNRLAAYEDFVAAALDLDDPNSLAEAFSVVEQAKSRALLDLVGGALDLAEAAEQAAADPAEASLLADLARLRGELNWYYSRLNADDEDGWRGTGIGETWQQAVHERERALDALQDRIAVARGLAGLYAPPLSLEKALRLLPTNAALVEYFVAGEELFAFVLRNGKLGVFRDLARAGEITHLLRRFQFQIGRALAGGERAQAGPRADRLLIDARRESGALDAVLLAPLRAAVDGAERLVIVPHGPLHALPFHALWNAEQGRYLIEACEVVYAPSASVLAHLPSVTAPEEAGAAVVVGVPDALAPKIAAEAEQVAGALGSRTLLLGAAATVDRVMTVAPDAHVLHLACHGRFSAESPLGSGLKLADRWLTVRDIYTLRLRATLVTLSGCDTGRTAIGSGDELVGLVRGFFTAGASSLILSLWLVNDESTAQLMAAFYDAWRKGASKPAALRQAQRMLLATRPHPAFWAPFILGGNP